MPSQRTKDQLLHSGLQEEALTMAAEIGFASFDISICLPATKPFANPLMGQVMFVGGDQSALWISLDMLMLSAPLCSKLRTDLSNRLNIHADAIVIHVMHNHTSLDDTPLLGSGYDDWLELLVNASFKAISNAEPAYYTHLRCPTPPGVFVRRRQKIDNLGEMCVFMGFDTTEDGIADAARINQNRVAQWYGGSSNMPDLPDNMLYDEPVDDLDLVLFRNASAKPLGSIARFSGHVIAAGHSPVPHYNSDFPGILRNMIEEQYGGVCMTVNGPCGDITDFEQTEFTFPTVPSEPAPTSTICMRHISDDATHAEVKRLGIALGKTFQQQITEAISAQKAAPGDLGRIIVDLGHEDDRTVAKARAEVMNMAFIDLSTYKIDSSVTGFISEQLARKHKAIPLGMNGSNLMVAMADPNNIVALQDMRIASGAKKVIAALATENDVMAAIDRCYKASEDDDSGGSSFTQKHAPLANLHPAVFKPVDNVRVNRSELSLPMRDDLTEIETAVKLRDEWLGRFNDLVASRAPLSEVKHAADRWVFYLYHPLFYGEWRYLWPEDLAKRAISADIVNIRIGDLLLCALPGEVFFSTGRIIRDTIEQGGLIALTAGECNGDIGYLPPADERPFGDYETCACVVVPEAADIIQCAAIDGARKLS